jgi:eukaryotic translation initiation factor 2C
MALYCRYPDGQVPPPDMQVENTENMTAMQAKKTTPTIDMPQRPGYGVAGKGVTLWANYFTLTSQKDLQLYRYQVDLAPDARGKTPTGKKLKRIIQLLIQEHFPGSASDYRANIVSRQKLELKDEYKVVYMAEDEDTPDAKAPQYTCSVQATGSITLAALIDHLTSTQVGRVFGNKEETIQALNIVLGHHPKSQATIATVGANRHFEKMARGQERMDLGAGLQVIRGYFMSVRAATSRLLVNVQVKNMAFYQEGPLDGIMAAYSSANGPHKMALLKFVKKLSVDVTHIKRQNKRGQRIPRIKIVQGFATKDDGRKLPHPPKVPQFGAGAKDVQFWLEESGGSASVGPGKGKGKGKAPKAGPAPPSNGRYISVFDFFKTSKLTPR